MLQWHFPTNPMIYGSVRISAICQNVENLKFEVAKFAQKCGLGGYVA